MSYQTFYDIYLSEMPMRVNGSNDFDAQLEMVRENLKYNNDVEVIAPGVYKTTNDNQVTYWHGDASASNVSIIVDTEIFNNFQKVTLTSKNPSAGKNAVYASDLYAIIKNDSLASNLVFASDNMMSDDAVKLWSRLISQGHKISVFDSNSGKYVLTPVTTQDELQSFVGSSEKHRYIFVMSESLTAQRGVIHANAIMELKRKSGYPLQEMFTEIKNRLK